MHFLLLQVTTLAHPSILHAHWQAVYAVVGWEGPNDETPAEDVTESARAQSHILSKQVQKTYCATENILSY